MFDKCVLVQSRIRLKLSGSCLVKPKFGRILNCLTVVKHTYIFTKITFDMRHTINYNGPHHIN